MCCVYLDDIVISVDEHNKNLKLVLDRLQAHGLKLKKTKCHFMQKSIEYLGHKLDNEGIHHNGRKCEAVQKAPRPTHVGELRSKVQGRISKFKRPEAKRPEFKMREAKVQGQRSKFKMPAFKKARGQGPKPEAKRPRFKRREAKVKKA